MSKPSSEPVALFWYRRDLRLNDNAGLYHALRSGFPVLPVFIFDQTILDALDDKHDRRLEFIHNAVLEMQREFREIGTSLLVRYGKPLDVYRDLLKEFDIQAVYTNYDYEVYAKDRDKAVTDLLSENGAEFHAYKDQTIFDRDEILTGSGSPYTVFTPYSRNWHHKLTDFYLKSYPTKKYYANFLKTAALPIPTLEELGFKPVNEPFPGKTVRAFLLDHYKETRDFPALKGTSELSIHLRFGTISIRELARKAKEHNFTFLNELVWRDFYFQVLDHFPHVEKHSFRREYDRIPWRNHEDEFQRWCEGRTGYPIVDAGMRQLNEIGWMHNRVRMITASFLCKHLLIDWRWGEAYFAKKLRDYDLSANNGGWQWAAGSGTDAAPYFRVFNPTLQAQKFDPKGEYIRRWVPEFNSLDYVEPMVEHTMARNRAIESYKKGLAAAK
ncbi:cryptochrome/photolyase family protein [Larkinella humicola]|uniref:Deoxyribodipyrimidine photo-lyase n=1 Tax=Larkinella humicola TaxID=2607654 RepID=A0A5N1JAQ3_9BACT|nr:deoxyribodipyrimidine photo-lyase [Larkinella humicola]KAA9347847.1 deoxyribodipyrimidine photo-lyase [Larkinella humicola]